MSPSIPFELDAISGLVRVSAQHSPGEVERALNEKGYSVGIWPEADPLPLSRYLRGDRALEPYLKTGDLGEFLAAVAVRFPDGRTGQTLAVPRSAAGPSLRHLLTGTRGRLPDITDVHLRVRPLPTARERRVFRLPPTEALAFVRGQIQSMNTPAVTRIYGPPPLGLSVAPWEDALLVLGYEGEGRDATFRMSRAMKAAEGRGARPVTPAEHPLLSDAAAMPPLFLEADPLLRPEAEIHGSVWWRAVEDLLADLTRHAGGLYPLQVSITGGWHEAALVSVRLFSRELEQDRGLRVRAVEEILGLWSRYPAALLGLHAPDDPLDFLCKGAVADGLTERMLRP